MSEVRVTKEQPLVKREAQPVWPMGEFFAPMSSFGRFFGSSPFALMREFTEEMDRVFRGAVLGDLSQAWVPAVDVRQCGGSLVVTAELPGVKKEEVNVQLKENNLILEGERRREHKEDHEGFHRTERSYGRFYRSIPLPEGARTEEAKAELTDGLLKISMPVAEAKKNMRQIKIEEQPKTTPTAA